MVTVEKEERKLEFEPTSRSLCSWCCSQSCKSHFFHQILLDSIIKSNDLWDAPTERSQRMQWLWAREHLKFSRTAKPEPRFGRKDSTHPFLCYWLPSFSDCHHRGKWISLECPKADRTAKREECSQLPYHRLISLSLISLPVLQPMQMAASSSMDANRTPVNFLSGQSIFQSFRRKESGFSHARSFVERRHWR